MKKIDTIVFTEVYSKIVTYDGIYYTVGIHNKDEILEMKKAREEILKNYVDIEDIVKELVAEDICRIVTNPNDLIYLPFESKIINRKEIKESLIQYK